MGKKSAWVFVLMFGLGVAFTGCNTTSGSKDTTTKFKGDSDKTWSRNTTTGNQDNSLTGQPKDSTPSIGQQTSSMSSVSDPHLVSSDLSRSPTPGVSNRMTLSPTTSGFANADNSMAPVTPPGPSNLQAPNKMQADPSIHTITSTPSPRLEDASTLPVSSDTSPSQPTIGKPLPGITPASNPTSASMPSLPSAPSNFVPPAPPPSPTSGSDSSSLSTSVPALPPIPVASPLPPINK